MPTSRYLKLLCSNFYTVVVAQLKSIIMLLVGSAKWMLRHDESANFREF